MRSVAYVVGTSDGPTNTLLEVARGIGFEATRPFVSLAIVEEQMAITPVCFFLFSQVPDVAMLDGIISPLRACKRNGVRFSPMIYFCADPSREVIRDCISMGFDDVISMPLTYARVQRNLIRHVDQKITYYETQNYFGPDRITATAASPLADRRRDHSDEPIYTQYDFVRSFANGVTIVGSNVVAA